MQRCAPRTPGRLGGIEGGHRVFTSRRGKSRKYLTGRGIMYVESAAIGRLPPLAADQQAGRHRSKNFGLKLA